MSRRSHSRNDWLSAAGKHLAMSRLREEKALAMSRLREEKTLAMSRLREEKAL